MPSGPATCAQRGCANPVAVSGGRPMAHCAPCLMGNRPAMRRKLAGVALVDAMPALAQPPGGFAFRVPGSPVGVNRAFMVGRGRIQHTPLAREWRRVVAVRALAARPRGWSLEGVFALDVHSVFASPLADVDGPIKLVSDALQGVAYVGDRQVLRTTASKAVDPAAARVEIVVRRLGPSSGGQP